MQSSFDNGKPNLRRVDKNHYGKIFSKISKEMKFFYPSSLHDKTVWQIGFVVFAQSPVFQKLPL